MSGHPAAGNLEVLYLLDANVPIDANRDYYPIDRVPEFWEWLVGLGNSGQVKIPQEIYAEVVAGTDAVAGWLKEQANAMRLEEQVSKELVTQVIEQGYAADLNDDELENIGQDPFLIAFALARPVNRVVVSNENSRPARQRGNRHVPDVCQGFNIRCVNTFALIRELDFRTR